MKVCFKCGETKPLSEFYKHAQMADGHLNKCKACAKADVLAHRADNLDAIRAYDRERAKLPHRVAAATAVTKAWRKNHPGRNAAHLRAERHHRKAPLCCQMCGLSKKLERHHPDYDLPLLVVWLCKPCHAMADAVRRQKE